MDAVKASVSSLGTEEARQQSANDLVTIIAHELHNQLTPLKGRIDLILRRAEKEGESRNLDDARQASRSLERIQRMVADLLDVSRIDRGILALSPRQTDLVRLARESVDEMRTAEANLDLRAPAELNATVDPERVRQVVRNLVGNAIQHTPNGTPITVTVARRQRDEAEWASIIISDDGPGIIPMDILPILFSRYHSGPGSSGLGLGLFLARCIARAHGGDLAAESKPGEGARFEFTLPLG